MNNKTDINTLEFEPYEDKEVEKILLAHSEQYLGRNNQKLAEQYKKAKEKYGEDLLIVGHFYINAELLQYADIVGDSYKLATVISKSNAKYIIFLGVKFMAETAAALAVEGQKILFPNFSAGCPLSDFADASDIEEFFNYLESKGQKLPVPIIYVNSGAEEKTVVAQYGGFCCTSSNIRQLVKEELDKGNQVLLLPDSNLGSNVARALNIPDNQLFKIPKKLDFERIDENVKIILWHGFCIVHQTFSVKDMEKARLAKPDCKIIVHPECKKEVASLADYAGSTSGLLQYLEDQQDGETIFVGTDFRFVESAKAKFTNLNVYPLRQKTCLNMSKVEAGVLADTLENLNKEDFSDEVKLDDSLIKNTRIAITGMIDKVEALNNKE